MACCQITSSRCCHGTLPAAKPHVQATTRRNPQISHIREGSEAVTKAGGLLLVYQICAFALLHQINSMGAVRHEKPDGLSWKDCEGGRHTWYISCPCCMRYVDSCPV